MTSWQTSGWCTVRLFVVDFAEQRYISLDGGGGKTDWQAVPSLRLTARAGLAGQCC